LIYIYLRNKFLTDYLLRESKLKLKGKNAKLKNNQSVKSFSKHLYLIMQNSNLVIMQINKNINYLKQIKLIQATRLKHLIYLILFDNKIT